MGVHTTIAEHLGVAKDQIRIDKNISESGADSLDLIVLVMEFEERFNIELSDKVCAKIETWTDLVSAICNELKL
jgi:acyl carrier protein